MRSTSRVPQVPPDEHKNKIRKCKRANTLLTMQMDAHT
jgi:hypothetical protein